VTSAVTVPLTVAAVGAVAALLATPVARRVALRLGITDNPDARKAHTTPTPYLGGLAIAFGIVAGVLAGRSFSWAAGAVAAGAFLLVVLGVLDDLYNLSPVLRLALEAGAAAFAVAGGLRFPVEYAAVAAPLAGIWIVLLANSVNLLDNMDGAAASSTGAVAAVLAVGAAVSGLPLTAVFAAATAGACLGFLRWNWRPARIFMGDGGSLLLGYLLAVGSLAVVRDAEPLEATVAALLFAALPLFDTSLVVISRRRAGRSFLQGGTDHSSHRLRRSGLSVGAAAATLATAAAGTATVGLLVARSELPAVPVMVLAVAVWGILLTLGLRVPCYPGDEARRRTESIPLPRH
jgi:UDP-GlcNAc:undecaprenyl-phosphate GlcNAc-1-phosphate transferase